MPGELRCTKSWESKKRLLDSPNLCILTQELHERQLERHKAKEEEEAHVIRSREECDKAFRE